MRICILSRGDLFPPNHGAAARIVRSAEALIEAGCTVFLVSDDRDAYLGWQDGWQKIPYGPHFRALEEAPGLKNQAFYEKLCRKIGYPLEESFLYRPVVEPVWWLKALYIGIKERIDVFQAEFPGFAMPAWLAAKALGTQSVLSQHNVEYDRLRQLSGLPESSLKRIRWIETALMKQVDTVLALSKEDRLRMQQVGVKAEKIVVIPHGVDLKNYQGIALDLRKAYALPSGPVLFFHGTLHYAPNTEAVHFLHQQLLPRLPPDASILMAGLSPLSQLETARFRFCGPVENLNEHIAGADLCLCPIFAGGGTRMKLLEYFAAGKAVISTPLGAEGLGYTDELRLASKEQFVEVVLELLEKPLLREELGKKARRFASARDWSAIATSLQTVYQGKCQDFIARPSIEAHLPPRIPSKPLTLLLLINRGCNLRCAFCDLWQNPENMPYERVLKLLQEAVLIGTKTLVITGGEPTLHPDLPRIVQEARKMGLAVNITTNGTLLDRHYEPLKKAGVSSLSFSIDGTADTHDRLRGQKGAFERTWTQLVRARLDGMDCSVYFTVTRENVRELLPIYQKVQALGSRFDFWPVNDAPALYLRPEDKEAWEAAVSTIGATDPAVAAKAHYYQKAFAYHTGLGGKMRCLGLVDQYGVTFKGELLPCCVWGGEGLKVGNVFKTPLSTLWHSKSIQAFREHLYRDGCAVGCYNHSLYEFTASTGESHQVGKEYVGKSPV